MMEWRPPSQTDSSAVRIISLVASPLFPPRRTLPAKPLSWNRELPPGARNVAPKSNERRTCRRGVTWPAVFRRKGKLAKNSGHEGVFARILFFLRPSSNFHRRHVTHRRDMTQNIHYACSWEIAPGHTRTLRYSPPLTPDTFQGHPTRRDNSHVKNSRGKVEMSSESRGHGPKTFPLLDPRCVHALLRGGRKKLNDLSSRPPSSPHGGGAPIGSRVRLRDTRYKAVDTRRDPKREPCVQRRRRGKGNGRTLFPLGREGDGAGEAATFQICYGEIFDFSHHRQSEREEALFLLSATTRRGRGEI